MMEARIVASLQAALEANEVATALDPHEAAYFILNSWEGALTRMKTEKSLEPLVVFDKMIFGFLLRTTGEDDQSPPKNDTDCKK
jgi:TetR/AcrR family transcriptional repressor of nem operon